MEPHINSIEEQARINVENRHHARMKSLDKRETEAVRRLKDRSKNRQQQKGKPTQALNRAADRRTGTDRRRSDDRRQGDDRPNNRKTHQSRHRSDTNSSQSRQSLSTRPTRSFKRRR